MKSRVTTLRAIISILPMIVVLHGSGIAGPQAAAKAEKPKRAAVRITGMFSDMHYSEESGDIGGTEIFIVMSLDDRVRYHALVQFAFGMPDASVLVDVREVRPGEIEFQVPGTKLGKFHGRVTADALTGQFDNGFAIRLKRPHRGSNPHFRA